MPLPAVRRRHSRLLLFFALLATFLLSSLLPVFAQEATVVGTVSDPSGSVVPNVKIVATNNDTGLKTVITSNGAGEYVLPDLHIGHYNISAQATGFKATERKDVVLNVGDRTRVDFQMQVGATSERVTVEADAAHVQSDTSEISDVVTGQQITQLATNGRSVFDLEALTPGASSVQSDFQVPTSAGGDFMVSFNGQRASHNLWVIDGGEAADRGGGGGSDVLPSMDAIAEFRTMTSNYSAEYGLSSAGTMTMAIKSGTKQLHATAYYFGRNDALDARNYFNPAPNRVAELRFHDWGFNVGGPVEFKHSENPKTFFFYNMEWRRYIQGGLFNVTTPLASMYPDAGGAGTGAVLPSTLGNGNALQVNDPCDGVVCNTGNIVPASIQFANCGGVAPAGVTPGKAFPNNTIPDCMINANATAILKAGIFPTPTNGWQFIGGNKQPTTAKEEITRIDHQFNDKFSVFGHFIADQAVQTFGTTMWSGDNVPSIYNTFNNPSYAAVVHTMYIIKPNLLNEVAFNYNGNRIHILPLGVYQQPSGFTEGANRIFNGTNADNRIPTIVMGGSTGSVYTSNWMPWNNTADDYQVRDDLSWTKGSHQLKFGAGWALYKKVQDYFAFTQGTFAFDGSFTSPAGCVKSPTSTCGLDFADLLLGYAQNYQEDAVKSVGYWNSISPDAYIQDNWRATHRLTLNLGLRWDGIPHTYEANNHMANFYPNLYNPANAATFANSSDTQIASTSKGLGSSPVSQLQGYQFYLNGMGIEGQNGVPKGLANNSWFNFGPRVGFAYDLTGNGTTVVRGGFGLMYERIQGNDMYNAARNVPWSDNASFNNVLFNDPHLPANGGGAITVPIVPAAITGINRYYPSPRNSQYSLGVQRSMGRNAVLSVSYVGSQDRHESYWQEINLPPASLLACLQASSNCTGAQPAFNGVVQYPGYSAIKQAFNGANSHYNSLQTELRGQVTRDLTLQVSYTLSRAIDPSRGVLGNGGDLDAVTNPYGGWRYDVGPSMFDRTHVAFVNFMYDIPAFRSTSNHLLKATLGGWELSGIVTMQSGAPLDPGLSGSGLLSGLFPLGDVSNRPDLTGKISYPHTVNQWFDPAAFSFPAAGTWGNLGFDALRGPGRDNWNLSLFKSFLLSESRGTRFEFRAESFNTWNHTQFGGSGLNAGISDNLGSSNFGAVTQAFDPRVFQLGGKLIF